MIKSFKNKALATFAATGKGRKLPVQNHVRVREILALLDVAQKPSDMNLPGLVFHTMAPGMPGVYSVRVTGNWRILFAFEGEDVIDVDIVDPH